MEDFSNIFRYTALVMGTKTTSNHGSEPLKHWSEPDTWWLVAPTAQRPEAAHCCSGYISICIVEESLDKNYPCIEHLFLVFREITGILKRLQRL